MVHKKADLFQRFIAALIDGGVSWVFIIVPVIGGILSVLYLLFKDGIMYRLTKEEDWKNRSIGKKLMNLETRRLDGGVVDLTVSARRNTPLAIGNLIAIIPILGWIIGPLVSFVFALIEIFFILIDRQGRRLGDRWAHTQVVQISRVVK